MTMHGTALSSVTYSFFQQELLNLAGIVLDDGKRYLVEARLAPLAQQLGLAGLDDLAAEIRAGRHAVRRRFVEAMTTHETYFFREPRLWEALAGCVLPELLGRRASDRKLRFWSAGASSGQEAYSLAMVLAESGLRAPDVEIRATDISEQILEIARRGRYTQMQVGRGLPARYLLRYFTRDRLEWVVSDEIRAMVHFEQGDLRRETARPGVYDAILCRNVLIYFDASTKRSIVANLRASLARHGYLALGCAENLMGLDEGFEPVSAKEALLFRAKER